jgi:hypothetical protein
MLKERGIALLSLEEKIDTSSAAGELVFHVFGAIAHFERRLIAERTKDGIAAAHVRGKRSGRKPLDADRISAALKLVAAGLSPTAAAHQIGLGRVQPSTGKSDGQVFVVCNRHCSSYVHAPRCLSNNRRYALKTRRVQFLGGNDLDDPDRPAGVLSYRFDKRLIEVLKDSTIWGKIALPVLMAFTTKYAVSLYENLAQFANLSKKVHQDYSLDEFRELLGVPPGRYKSLGN